MDRKKFCAVLFALMIGVVLSAGKVWALASGNITGYLMGDPAPGKLVPFFAVSASTSTVIGIENAEEDKTLEAGTGEDVLVHVTVFNVKSVETINFDLCLSPLDFGFVVLQKAAPSPGQLVELVARNRGAGKGVGKISVLSSDNGDIPTIGYVTLRAVTEFFSSDGTCGRGLDDPVEENIPTGVAEPLAVWSIYLDIGSGFFGTEIPTLTANVVPGDPQAAAFVNGIAKGGLGAFGLIPKGNRVLARFDVNPLVLSHTDIFVWLAHNNGAVPASLICEDQRAVSTIINLPNEVNIIDPAKLSGIAQCVAPDPVIGLPQYRGVLLFNLPETGFLWSNISQEGLHFRENFLGYNLECNTFIDPECESVFQEADLLPE